MNNQVIVAPLLALLKSRKFLVAAASLLAYILAQHIPALAGQQNTLAGLILALAGLVIGGIALEDAARNVAAGPQNWQDAVRDLVLETVNAILAQYSTPATPPVEEKPVVSGTSTEMPPTPSTGESSHV